jgi:hypothetical protein
MHRVDYGTIVIIDTRGVVGHVGYLRQEGHKGIGVCFCGEETSRGVAQKSRFIVVEAGD